jgi:hypothetical protein
MPDNKKLFLSAVSSEFLAYRVLLASDLMRPTLDVAVQEDFIVTGGSTLGKIDDYIRACDGVVHLLGKATGALPEAPAVADLLHKYPDFATKLPPLAPLLADPQPGLSYTQWEACLAIYHRRPLFIYLPTDFDLADHVVPRDARFVFSATEQQAQQAHHARICDMGHDRGRFRNEERLSSAVLRDLVEILPRLETTVEVAATKLPQAAQQLIGREQDLARLDAAWDGGQKNVVVVRAFGGMGKTALVASWMAELALKNWRGAERVFDWSFYSQGASDQRAASADAFMVAALTAFGDDDPLFGSAWDRGARLARLVGQVRCLLVLDGLEPLQYPPGPMQGKLKDPAIEALLKGLAAHNAGLCVVTTREKIPGIRQHYGRSADDFELAALSDRAGAALLHHHGATRAGAKTDLKPDDQALQSASREVSGHGLTLQLLGQYLRLVEGGDILKRDTVRLADADREFRDDATRPYGCAFQAMQAYAQWFQREGDLGQRQLAVLRLLGLFDRPASRDCLEALRHAPAIVGLTEPLVGLARRDWDLITNRLAEIRLITVQLGGGLDAHPLLREYFAMQLSGQQPEAWRAAHRRLYEHLCAHTKEGEHPTLEDLQPLYQAVAHGCQAGLHQQVHDDLYQSRIRRGSEDFPIKQLGAFGTDLGAFACFFEQPWSLPSPGLRERDQAILLGNTAFRLRAVGRLIESLEPLRESVVRIQALADWPQAAVAAGNLSELELTLGEVAGAVEDAVQAVTHADRCSDTFQRIARRATLADALHQAGRQAEAQVQFGAAEQMQAERQPHYPLLYSLQGFLYCNLLLAAAERAAWRPHEGGERMKDEGLAGCRAVSRRAAQTLQWAEESNASLFTLALDRLTLGRAALYAVILELGAGASPQHLEGPAWRDAVASVNAAVSCLRRAGHQQYLPLGLLTRAWQRCLAGAQTGPESAQSDLEEAWEIAERGPMPLFMADILLYRARLFYGEAAYPWASPQHDLAEARRLIFQHGYLRRQGELEAAQAAIQARPLAR